MNLKQLLSKVEFDDVAPFIVQHYPEMATCMAGFKMAFDGMRNTVPTNFDEEQITVGYYPEGSIEPSLSAYHSHDDEWENVVGHEVVVAQDVTASIEEIAAVILYDATFYGFTPEARSANFNKWWAIETPPSMAMSILKNPWPCYGFNLRKKLTMRKLWTFVNLFVIHCLFFR